MYPVSSDPTLDPPHRIGQQKRGDDHSRETEQHQQIEWHNVSIESVPSTLR